MNFTKNYTDLIAALIGDILDCNYPAEFLSKHNLKVELTEQSEDGQIVTVWLGKGKATRQFSVCSFRDIHRNWHHTVFGSLAELPAARQKQLHSVLDQIVTARIEEEEKGETKAKAPRRPRSPRKAVADKPSPDSKDSEKKEGTENGAAKPEPAERLPRKIPLANQAAPQRSQTPLRSRKNKSKS